MCAVQYKPSTQSHVKKNIPCVEQRLLKSSYTLLVINLIAIIVILGGLFIVEWSPTKDLFSSNLVQEQKRPIFLPFHDLFHHC